MRWSKVPAIGMAFAAASLLAQQSMVRESVSAPDSGYWFDATSATVRELRGYAGAMTAGRTVLEGLEQAFVSPNGRTAVIGRQGAFYWLQDLRQPDRAQAVAIGAADLTAWSANGDCFAAYAGEAGLITEVCRGVVTRSAPVDRGLQALALNRDGSWIAASGEDRLLRYSDATGWIATPGVSARSIVWDAAGAGVVIADRVSQSVLRVTNGGAIEEIASAAQLGGGELLAVLLAGPGRIAALTAEEMVIVGAAAGSERAVLQRLRLDAPIPGAQPIGPYQYLFAGRDSLGVLDFLREETVFFVPVTQP